MPLSKRPELAQYLPPDLVAEATKRLKETLLVVANNPELSLLELFATFTTQELNLRENVIPVGEAEATRLDQLARDLREQIGEATQNFGVFATRADNQDLLTARDKFRAETIALQQRLDEAQTVGGKTQEVVFALRDDAKSGGVIRDSLARLEKKGANMPLIVARAFLQSLSEQGGTPIERTAAASGQDFIATSRQAVVESSSRRAELPPPAEIETIVRVTRPPRAATAPKPSGRFGVKDVLETAGIDTSGLALIDPAHIAKALPGATRKLFNVEPTAEAMAETLLAIARQEADPDQFGEAASLKKLYGLGIPQSRAPEQSPSVFPSGVPQAGMPASSKPIAISPEFHAKAEATVGKPLYVMSAEDPLNQVFHFQGDNWKVQRWGDLAAIIGGGPKKIDRHSSGTRKAIRLEQREDVKLELREEIDAFVKACKSAKITTCQQVLDHEGRFRLPPKFKWVLAELGETPLTALDRLPGLIDLRSSPLKPGTRDELLAKLRTRR